MRRLALALGMIAVVAAVGTAAPAAGVRPGVVFFCPQDPAEAIRQLEEIKGQGFNLITFASWVWTLPTPGSDLERRAKAVLDWCDGHDMAFVLMHNIQYGNPGEGGGLEEQVQHPERTLPLLTDWARVLAGHPSVTGVILGNEVGPNPGSPEGTPLLWGQFRRWLAARHGGLAQLNAAWDPDEPYRSWDEVRLPPDDAWGRLDVGAYARERFAGFYGYLFDHAFRPVLGERMYGCKTNLDPFLHRACDRLTMTCWDDLLATWPLWQIKCAADTTGKPLFNSELHLYHDFYEYKPSVRQSRFRYLTSALNGETMTASFAWGAGHWSKPAILDLHRQTPGLLAELRRLAPYCEALTQAYQQADLAVLVTERNYYAETDTDAALAAPLAMLYRRLSSLGRPWRYVLEPDVARLKRGTLVVATGGWQPKTAAAVAGLPPAVRVLAVDRVPYEDQYRRPLPADLPARLRQRVEVVPDPLLEQTLGPAPGLPAAYQRQGAAQQWWWSAARGHYSYRVPACLLEARQAPWRDGLLVAVINHYDRPLVAPVPWASGRRVRDLVTGRRLSAGEAAELTFGPLDVRLFLLGD